MADIFSELVDYLSGQGTEDALSAAGNVTSDAAKAFVGLPHPNDHPLNQGIADEHKLTAPELAALHLSVGAPNTYRPGGTSNYITGGWPQVDPSLATISAPATEYFAANTSDVNPLNLSGASIAEPNAPVRLPPVEPTFQAPNYQQPNIPGYSNGVPQVQQPNPLVSLAAALLGGAHGAGGILNAASGVQQYQNQQSEHQALLSQQLYANSPADQMRKSQQGIYQSRMANDVSRYLDWIHKDVNGTIAPEERDRIWNQIRSNYAPLGIDPGPSPAQVEWQLQQDEAPEIRNAAIVEKFRGEYGDSAGDIAAGLLRADPEKGYEKLLEYQYKMQHVKTLGMKAAADIQKQQIDRDKKQIEEYRKVSLGAFKQMGANAGQLSKNNAGMVTSTGPYGLGESAVNSFYDLQQRAIESGRSVTPQRFDMGRPDLNKKNFEAYVNALANKVAPPAESDNRTLSPQSQSDALTAPAGSNLPFTQEQKTHATPYNSPADIAAARATANRTGRAVAANKNGVYGWVQPQSGL